MSETTTDAIQGDAEGESGRADAAECAWLHFTFVAEALVSHGHRATAEALLRIGDGLGLNPVTARVAAEERARREWERRVEAAYREGWTDRAARWSEAHASPDEAQDYDWQCSDAHEALYPEPAANPLDFCPVCGEPEPPPPPGPARLPGQWYCLAHRHLQPRSQWWA